MKMNRVGARTLAMLLLATLAAGCSKMTRFESPAEGSRLEFLGRSGDGLPRSEKMPSKSTGQHEFRASSPDGAELYGILPLRVSGGKMATSILLFAPALLIGGFRDVFPYYEIDPVAKVIRYRSGPDEEWRVYVPGTAEIERAKAAFAAAGRGAP
jgi:hypothetical protein